MNLATAMNPRALEAQMSFGAAAMNLLDTVFPVESAAKPTGMFSSDCCSSNNYDETPRENNPQP